MSQETGNEGTSKTSDAMILKVPMTEEACIQDLTPTSDAVPLRVRPIRKWLMYRKRQIWAYLLIDKHGHAIHALFKGQHEPEISKKINLMQCILLEDYECASAPTLFKVTNHIASIQLDSSLTVTPLEDNIAIPRRYYNFTSHENLGFKMGAVDLLTDFIGKVESMQFIEMFRDNNLLKVTLKSISGPTVVVALWKEINEMIDRNLLGATDHTVTLVVASAKVVNHHGTMQLESVAATRLEIDADIEETRELRRTYPHNAAAVVLPNIHITDLTSVEDKITIAALYQKNIQTMENEQFTCEATIVEVTPKRPWYFVTCIGQSCNRTIKEKNKKYVCRKHQPGMLRYKYCVNCTIEDHTGRVNVTLFDTAVMKLINTSCSDMITKGGYSELKTVPDPLQQIRGVKMIFKLQNAEMSMEGVLKFTSSRLLNVPPVKEENVLQITTKNADTDEKEVIKSNQSALVPVTPAITEKPEDRCSDSLRVVSPAAKKELFTEEAADEEPKKKTKMDV